MWKSVLAGTAVLAIVGTSFVYAQQQPPRDGGQDHQRWQFSPEDRAAFAAARIAALRAGLALNADQDKNWPAFETALKDLNKYRMERRNARRTAQPSDDPTERLRRAAEALSGYGAALKKLADAQQPLYSSLDQAQKRRFAVLARMMEHGHHAGGHRGGDRRGMRPDMRPGMDHGMERGMDRDMEPDMERGMMQHGQDWREEGRRDFGGRRDLRRFGRSDQHQGPDQDQDVPRLHAPGGSDQGKSL